MYSLYLMSLIGVIVSVVAYFMNPFKYKDKFMRFFSSFIILIVSAFLGILLSSIISIIDDDIDVTYEREKIEIVSLQDNSNASGRFFLGFGSIGPTDYYDFYVETEKGFKKERIKASQTTIQYTSEDPHLEMVYKIEKKSTKWSRPTKIKSFVEYVLKVPEGSVKEDFVLDAK